MSVQVLCFDPGSVTWDVEPEDAEASYTELLVILDSLLIKVSDTVTLIRIIAHFLLSHFCINLRYPLLPSLSL